MSGAMTETPTMERPAYLRLREPGWALLSGHGLEIGALHEPAPLPASCTVEYVDAITRTEAAALFPEVDANTMVEPHHIRDLDARGLAGLADGAYDFVVLSHVIEHVADPIAVLAEVFRVLRTGGLAVIAAPDKRFTFDRPRSVSTFEGLREAHLRGVDRIGDDRYLDFLAAVYPTLVRDGGPALAEALVSVRRRREHVHVWDSVSFTAFLEKAMDHLGIKADLQYASTGDRNQLEHFSVWRKVTAVPARKEAWNNDAQR
jgi:SAM-dependent methyltransferase